ncbi:uncharacterized protein LAJ45_07613 [Morchella importuna]|uniref:Glycosyl transferase CAP10 domain-containing protein n=1 Tax=Morchella conica CCBAS932 TaxID=1392247 RepID=A0A3N4L2N2_9PEZI|nr:uncharacterized protein LAJ45_07613 [Morchella importuna]KAH8148510.1 hypothetical protein LAJ45_07613 [Morchella importuna]RPB15762.1 hypothetical protein P167DRAFT_481967 [Morchella conica CCBAS932]
MQTPLLTSLPPRLLYIIAASLLLICLFSLSHFTKSQYTPLLPQVQQTPNHPNYGQPPEDPKGWIKPSLRPFDPATDGDNLFYNSEECDAKFPGLFTEIDVAKARGDIGEIPFHDGDKGYVKARIYKGKLYIVAKGDDVWHRQYAILHQIHRSLLTAPNPSEIPNIEFQFLVNDHPAPSTWSLAWSGNDGEVHDTWIMPDYGFWSWPEPHIGSYAEAKEKIEEVDRPLSWADKQGLAVWRGTVHWNGELRGKLLEVAKGKPWSDVAELDWKTNALKIEEFCKYKFLIYTEGVTYSGRLRYFQHCRSIIITPRLAWRQYQSFLLQSSGPDQNYVEVAPDWSDLEEKVQYYLDHPIEAERIANNTVRLFRDWYLTPAGEVCYWRKLFQGWASAGGEVGELKLEERGRSWESYVLMGKLDWEATA